MQKISFLHISSLFIILLIGSRSLLSQPESSIPYKTIEIGTSKKALVLGSIHHENNIYILFQTKLGRKGRLVIQKFNDQMNLLNQEELTFNNFESQFVGFEKLGGKLIFLTSEQLDKEKKVKYFAQAVDTESLKLTGPRKKYLQYTYTNNRNKLLPFFESSKNNERILAYQYEAVNRNSKEITINASMMNRNLDIIWEKQITLPYSFKVASVYDYEIDPKGNLYIVIREKHKNQKGRFQFYIHSFTGRNQEETTFELNLSDAYVFDVRLGISLSNELIASGFYATPKTKEARGVFFSKFDIKNKKMLVKSKKDIALDLITKNESDRTKERVNTKVQRGRSDKLQLYNFNIDDFIIKDDGGIVVVSEQFYITTVCNTDPNGFRSCVDYYNYNDIIVISISPDGDIDWTQKLIKRQNSQSRYFSSYGLHISDDKLYFIFNDNMRNYKLDDKSNYAGRHPMDVTRNGITSIVEINNEGDIKKEILFKNRNTNNTMAPANYEQISENKFVIFGRSRKKKNVASVLTF